MKICAIICEYNPFHNGHLYHLQEAKRLSGADALLCIMSGNFVQRGEAAILNKYTRARHAVLGGADAVIELPTPFATANAELFAKGALHILSSIPDVTSLCFGAENADKQAFLHATTLLNDEPDEVSNKIKELTEQGISYAKARATAWEGILPQALLTSPNNLLGVEYMRAILQKNAAIDILPISRIGGGYKEETLQKQYASATAIRAALPLCGFEDKLPAFVLPDLPKQANDNLDLLEKYAILRTPTEQIAKVCDCTEGLENAFKRAAELPTPLVTTLTSARYTSSRIRRIALQALLNVTETLIRESLQSPLYLRVLATKKERKEILSSLSQSAFPLLLRAHDENALCATAKTCYERDIFSEKIHALLYPTPTKKDIFV